MVPLRSVVTIEEAAAFEERASRREECTLVHCSDLHFYHPWGLFSARWTLKRLLGWINGLRRRSLFPLPRQRALVERLRAMAWDHLLISGDLTQIGCRAEFALATRALAPLLGLAERRVTVIPGNHDRYVREPPQAAAFDRYFGAYGLGASCTGAGDPGADGSDAAHAEVRGAASVIGTTRLTRDWWLCAWDSAFPRPLFSASGRVPAATLEATRRWRATLPASACVLLLNHYPLYYPPGTPPRRHHDLENLEEVREFVAAQRITLYLHGHEHQNWCLPVEGMAYPERTVCSGASIRQGGAHRRSGFHEITLQGSDFAVRHHPF